MSQLPLTLPLRGSQLIEASAGTGKTFTIALLYVRLVLGHGQPDSAASALDNGFPPPLVPPDILVVTFPEAASQELRDRIRARLVQAAEAFRATSPDDGLDQRDPLLAALRDDFVQDAWASCARRLTLAAEWMDDAAISTIHSWCQRMLKEHAFDSGKLFRQELIKDLTEVTREAVTDYWRTRVYPLSEPLAAAMVSLFDSPQVLQEKLRNLLQREDATLVFCGQPLEAGDFSDMLARFSQSREAARQHEAEARQAYRGDAEQIHETLRKLREAMNGTVFRGVKDDDTFEGWLAELTQWGRGNIPLDQAKFVQKLASGRFKVKKGAEVPEHAFFDALEAWRLSHEDNDTLQRELLPQVLADAQDWVSRRLAEQLAANAQMGFNDMIRGLSEALTGDGGDGLARRIREQFPVAMIDEFQDTDPAQYRIFERIYRVGAPAASEAASDALDLQDDAHRPTALILIGDPKQAIYGFRGGDIYTYLSARQATLGHHHSLDTNFRSSDAAVAAVNQLFLHAEKTHERGAFRFADPALPAGQKKNESNPLPFHKVGANGRKEILHLDGQPTRALVGWLLENAEDDGGCLNKDAYLRVASRHCANRIAGWLNQAGENGAGFATSEKGEFTPLKAGDIAILVRDRKEAGAIRDALSERGLTSVYLSDRDSVFGTAEARDLLRWLKAMANPESVSTLRTALATATLGLPLAELDRLQRDEAAWEQAQEQFIGYRQRWQHRGILPALRQLLHDYRIPARLLDSDLGQRRLTNLLHLAEWAQQASDTLDGDHALIRLLAEHVQEPGYDEQILRLESDADLIQVVTIFKSKGLEYPVVCLPFLCTYKEVTGKFGTPLYHQDDQPMLELAPKKEMAKEGFELADDERLSEEVRLIYVALTRARHATFVGLAPLKVGNSKTATLHKSALGYLLAGGESLPDLAGLREKWQQLSDDCDAITLEPGESALSRYQPVTTETPGKSARRPGHRAFTPWWIASYSALQQKGAAAPETPEAEILGEEHAETRQAATPRDTRAPAAETLHAFPRGPGPGTFLHGILEALANHGFAGVLEDEALLARMLQRCRRRGWEAHVPALGEGIKRWLTIPLAPEGQKGPVLAKLERYRAEPDFWFATAGAITPAMDKLTREYLFPGEPRPKLGYQQLNGLLKGFIDLLAEHEGKVYVIDWKSNWLGADDDAYQETAMQAAMLDKRYDMQLALYLVALHRHLRQTLPDYDYDRHVGGAMLVFLRGIGAPSRGVAPIKPPKAFVEAMDRCLAGHYDTTPERDTQLTMEGTA
ncbi:exodeoxyribonuclease V subunit beta [Halomonas chromatireducens]|uniref:RecBCD enzyme subunit RecB n=1 Tax=Halomonas chromatireducens TaxID=507626 RepID=A0A0X8HDD0_9GAMM|nr:exodeoxyribonuclease V subunit beta [Halomonas chromatireducens]AMD00551.1 RecBCD enzyme subunit RecB [Halomonas chromatireducens]